MMTRKVTPGVLGTVIAAIGAIYLIMPPREGCACGTVTSARSQLKDELRNLLTAQEFHFADSLRYTTDTAALLYFRPRGHLRLSIDTATAGGFRARVVYANLESRMYRRAGECLLWHGDSSLAVPSLAQDEPRCLVPKRPLWRFGAYRGPEARLQ